MSARCSHKNAVTETTKGICEHVVERGQLDAMEEGCHERTMALQPNGEGFRRTATEFVLAVFQRVGALLIFSTECHIATKFHEQCIAGCLL